MLLLLLRLVLRCEAGWKGRCVLLLLMMAVLRSTRGIARDGAR